MYTPYESDKIWNALLGAATSGIKAGVKSVIKDILSTVGKAVLEFYAPAIADIFFNSSELDVATERIVDEIRDTHSDLADRHREMFEEMLAMYRSDIAGSFDTGFTHLTSFTGHSDPILRMRSLGDLLPIAIDRFTNIRTTLEAYILLPPAMPASGDQNAHARIQFCRLQLLSYHIQAARLELAALRLYWGWRAIQITFEAEHGATSTSAIFEEWQDSLSQEQMDAIQDIADGDGTEVRLIYEQVFSFYETLTNRDDLSNYIEAIFTPLVQHMETFNGNPSMFDRDDVTDEANWGIPDGAGTAVAPLDGQRWYYYVDVLRAGCLEGYAYRQGLSNCHHPWAEVPGEPSQSDCNRYWIVNPHAASSTDIPSCPLRASLDAYNMWFASDSMDIYNMHKELIKGDLLRTIYGPSSLILDAMYTEFYGSERPANRWDEWLARYDVLVGLLGAGSESYEEAVEASETLLDRCGVSPQDPGLFIWYEMLRMQVRDPLNPPACPDTFEENNTWEQAAQIEPGYYNRMNLNVPGDIDIYQFELLADNSVLIELVDYDETFTSPPIVELWRQLPDEDEPSRTRSASEHEEYDLSILLPSSPDETYRHRKMTAFVKVYSPDDQTGEYAIAIQTKGSELASGRDSEPDSSGSTTGIGTIPTDDTMIVRETDDEPYRVEPESTEESDSGSSSVYQTIALRSTIYTGGAWITDHAFLNQLVGADEDRYVVEVPVGLTLEISAIPSASSFGMPYAELEDSTLMARATIDDSQWPEGGHTIRVRPPATRWESSRDVFFKVSGLYNRSYRRDTGGYRLIVTVEGIIGVRYGLSALQRRAADDAQRMPSHHDIRDLGNMYVEFAIARIPDNPGDPFLLAAIDYSSGSVIDYYKFNPSEYKSDLPFKTELQAFNKAQMGLTNTVLSLNNLGYQLQATGDYKEARPYFEQALAIQEKSLGAAHPDTISSLNNLGGLLKIMGDYKGARPYYERALAINKKALGPEHPDTAQSLNNLGEMLYEMGDLVGAQPYYEQALAIHEVALGSDHLYTRAVRDNLVSLNVQLSRQDLSKVTKGQ